MLLVVEPEKTFHLPSTTRHASPHHGLSRVSIDSQLPDVPGVLLLLAHVSYMTCARVIRLVSRARRLSEVVGEHGPTVGAVADNHT